jgi:hypothetical protein
MCSHDNSAVFQSMGNPRVRTERGAVLSSTLREDRSASYIVLTEVYSEDTRGKVIPQKYCHICAVDRMQGSIPFKQGGSDDHGRPHRDFNCPIGVWKSTRLFQADTSRQTLKHRTTLRQPCSPLMLRYRLSLSLTVSPTSAI